MSEIKFDYSKKTFEESLGFNDEESLGFNDEDSIDLIKKQANLSTKIVTNDLDGNTITHVSEEIAKIFSYNELLIMSTYYLLEKTKKTLEADPFLMFMAKTASEIKK